MPNYSKDSDMAIFEQDVTSLGDLAKYHTEATAEINRRLRARNLDNADIAALSAQTIADLIPASCEYVLYLAYGSQGAHEAAERHYIKFKDRMANVSVEIDTNADGTAEETIRGGYVELG